MRKFLLLLMLCVMSLEVFAHNLWTVEADNFNGEYTGAPVANGMIGILPWKEPFSIRHVVLNHVFDLYGINVVLKGINPFQLKMSVDGKAVDASGISDWHQTIDMKRALHITDFVAYDKVEITYTVAALRNMPYGGLVNVKVKALQPSKIDVTAGMDVPKDLYKSVEIGKHTVKADGHQCRILQGKGVTSTGRYRAATSSMLCVDKGDFALNDTIAEANSIGINLKKGEEAEFTLMGSLCTTRDFNDPENEADRQVIHMMITGKDRLLKLHERMWDALWKGDIEIEGDDEAQQVVRFALFNLYGNCREGSRLSIPPMGLSGQFYSGHIFWDAEIWMYPAMLYMNQGIARSMVDYRCDRLEAAKRRAMASGYQGAMYPWESDDFGEESTPTSATTGSMEHHVTADVAIAVWNYYKMTHDKVWLKEHGWPVLREVAEFWVSRVEPNDDGSYSVNQVIGADEYAININDNAFTNGSAKIALYDAIEAARVLGETAPERWKIIADGLRIIRKDGITLEHADYDGRVIKQADVNLLAYPLGVISDPKDVCADLDYYVQRLDLVNGPAMSYSIFSIIYSQLGDVARAEDSFRKSYRPNMRAPFGVLSETPVSQNPYFATGAGGMLQAVINGFGGLELTDYGIVQRKTTLPRTWRKLTIKGVGPDQTTYTVNNQNM